MLSFACEFPVREVDTRSFVGAVRRWIEGSPHTTFSAADLESVPSDGHWVAQSGLQRLEALIADNGECATAGFRHVVSDGSIEWRTTVVYSRTADDCWVGVRTNREADQARISLPPAKKPLIVRTLLSQLGGGLDGEVFCRDEPLLLKANDLGMSARLLNGDADNYLPVVFVSRDFTGELNYNVAALARSLGGMAHVLVEPDRAFSRRLQADVGSRNAYGGSVGVYWPTGESYKYFLSSDTPTEYDVRQLIVARIRMALVNRRPLSRCTWSRAEADVARNAFKKLQSSGSEDVREYVSVFDSEMRAKDRQLEEAEAEVRQLRSRLRQADANIAVTQVGLNIENEQEFYPGEFSEIVRGAVESSIENAQNGGRRSHVLAAFAATLPSTQIAKAKRERLKGVLRDYTSMTKPVRAELESLGFQIFEDGKHMKLVYMHDDRYSFILPKSGSDHRGGKNAVSDISKRVF